ncbi:CinA family protein [Mesoplasma photuris]|uniref:CinA family protein n=1 Tax=Mesoplasma photuris TaxID=217731 RepID=UPI0004E28C48|nr:CinA family protein [Mesoplasma photuris]
MNNTEKMIKMLIDKKLTISTCESFTGGYIANAITNVEGSSKVFYGSFICYNNNFKRDIINIEERVIKKYGVVSAECSEQMALLTFAKTKTDIVLSFTGNTNGELLENKLSNYAFISIKYKENIQTFNISKTNLSRIEFKEFALNFVINELKKIINY